MTYDDWKATDTTDDGDRPEPDEPDFEPERESRLATDAATRLTAPSACALACGLATLLGQYGTMAVFEALRDACDAAHDVADDPNGNPHFAMASQAVQHAALAVARAEERGAVTLGMALDVLTDLPEGELPDGRLDANTPPGV